MLVTVLLSGVVIFLGASLLEWAFKKVAPKSAAGLGRVARTGAVVAIATAAYLYVMTRPSIVGPYEQWTFENIGGQLLGGVLAAAVKIWTNRESVGP